MYIQCKNCNHYEKTDKSFFVKIIGGVTASMGYWAWVAYFFAGTGFAMPICIAIMAGGGAMLAFSDKIIPWISKNYNCPKCNNNEWEAIDDEAVEKIELLNAQNAKYKLEIKNLSNELMQRKNELQEYIKKQIKIDNNNVKNSEYIKRLESDVDFLMEELENKENAMLELIQNQEELNNIINAYKKQEVKMIEKIKIRFRKLYQNVSIGDKSYKFIVHLNDDELLKFEQEIRNLDNGKLNFRDNIYGADVKEIDFSGSGRIYIRKIENCYNVVCVGNKNTQDRDIDWLKKRYPK